MKPLRCMESGLCTEVPEVIAPVILGPKYTMFAFACANLKNPSYALFIKARAHFDEWCHIVIVYVIALNHFFPVGNHYNQTV